MPIFDHIYACTFARPSQVVAVVMHPFMQQLVDPEPPGGGMGATLSLLSDLPKRLKQGAIVLEVQSGTFKQRFFVTLDFGG